MRCSIRLNENEIRRAVKFWLMQDTTSCNDHDLEDSEISLGTGPSGAIYAEAAWEEDVLQ